MEFKEFEYQLQILEHHLDTFGHVNNATYLELYEQARWDFISKNGYGLDTIESEKKGPVILEVNCRYKREITNRETITIKSKSISGKGKIGQIFQQIFKSNGEIASEATFTVGFMDLASRKLVLPTEKWLKAVGLEG